MRASSKTGIFEDINFSKLKKMDISHILIFVKSMILQHFPGIYFHCEYTGIPDFFTIDNNVNTRFGHINLVCVQVIVIMYNTVQVNFICLVFANYFQRHNFKTIIFENDPYGVTQNNCIITSPMYEVPGVFQAFDTV